MGLQPPESDTVTPNHVAINAVDDLPDTSACIGNGNVKLMLRPPGWSMLSSHHHAPIAQSSKRLVNRPRAELVQMQLQRLGAALRCDGSPGDPMPRRGIAFAGSTWASRRLQLRPPRIDTNKR